MNTITDVFISYARGDQLTAEGKNRKLIVDKIHNALKEQGYNVLIDVEQLSFKDNIKEFIQNLGKSKYIVIILSDKYLKSKWCMLEVVMMLEYPDFYKRIFPIVLEDAKIYDATGRADYIIYWQDMISNLDERVKRIRNIEDAIPILEEINSYKSIHKVIAKFSDSLGKMNVLKAEEHLDTNFGALLSAIKKQILNDTDNYETLKQKVEILKSEILEIKDKNKKLLAEKEKQAKLHNEERIKLKRENDKKINDLINELKGSKEEIDRLEIENKELKEKENRTNRIEELEIQKRIDEQEVESQPFNVLKLKKEATSGEIEKQYSRLKMKYEEGINSATLDMKLVYENELINLEKAYEEIYLTVKEKEDKIISEAYTFLNLNRGASSNEIEENYKKLKDKADIALNSENQNIIKAAKENLIKLETHFQFLYNFVHQKETEADKRILAITPKNMVFVQGGKFRMGEYKGKDDLVNEVVVTGFFIDKYPLLVNEFRDFCEQNEIPMPKAPPWGWHDYHPMVNITWMEAFIYSRWIGKRLPTEAEWEFAARGGIKTKKFIYSGSNKIDDVAWYLGNSNNITNPVALKKPNELGIFDMSGNVWEWCNDWYAEYIKSDIETIDPEGPADGNARVLRGGSHKVDKDYCTVARRLFHFPNHFNESWGVRFVKDLPENINLE